MTKQIRFTLVTLMLFIITSIWTAAQTTSADDTAYSANITNATYIVNSTDDVTNGSCNSTHCIFREVINTAINNVGTDTILFDFPSLAAILSIISNN